MDTTIHTTATIDGPAMSPPATTTDQRLHAMLSLFTGGLSPTAIQQAWWDWAQHLLLSPDKQAQLVGKALHKWQRFGSYCERACRAPCESCIEPLPQDKRFRGEAWQRWPFNVLYQGFLLQQQWWHAATTGVPGVSRHHEAMVNFGARQLLDVWSPSNFLATNPEQLEQTRREGGANLARGASNLLEDWRRRQAGEGPEGGRSVSGRPGRGGDAGQGGLPQPAHRADPVRAHHAGGPGRHDQHRPRARSKAGANDDYPALAEAPGCYVLEQ